MNLGLIIDLPLWVYADALQRGVSSSSGSIRLAVLLVSPQRIGHTVSGPYFENLWLSKSEIGHAEGDVFALLRDCRGSWRASSPFRLIESPLHGEGRHLYGFASGVTAYMEKHGGAFVDPGVFRIGRREDAGAFEPSTSTLSEIARFNSIWMRQAPLAVCIAPIPASYAPLGYGAQRERLMSWLGAALGADRILADLPGTLPDALFASPPHLNANGQRAYSGMLARALGRIESSRAYPRGTP